MNDAYINNPGDDANESFFNALDGFAVSSSSRPFHLSQFSVESQTWPADSEFSWSQLQVNYFFFSSFENIALSFLTLTD